MTANNIPSQMVKTGQTFYKSFEKDTYILLNYSISGRWIQYVGNEAVDGGDYGYTYEYTKTYNGTTETILSGRSGDENSIRGYDGTIGYSWWSCSGTSFLFCEAGSFITFSVSTSGSYSSVSGTEIVVEE